jgi:hypothetical protein
MSFRHLSINKEIYSKPIKKPRELKSRMNISLYLPPTDIPEAILALYEKNIDSFKIKFQYSILEKGKYLFSNKQAKFLIGEKSGKPLMIEIKDIKKNNIDEIHIKNFIEKNLEGFIEEKLSEILDLRQKTNIERVKEVLTDNASDLAKIAA